MSSMTREYIQYRPQLEDPRAPVLRRGTLRKKHKIEVMGTRLSCTGVLWALMSFLTMGAACVGFYMPYWLEGRMFNDTQTFLGTFRRCNYPTIDDKGQRLIVMECGRYTTFWDIPSLWWQIATVTTGTGAGITILVAFTSLLAICLRDVISETSAKVMGVFQFLAGVCIGTGCLLYPLGWDTPEVHQVCGPDARLYHLGWCEMSWAYYCAIAGAGGCILCSLLSCHASQQKLYAYRS